MRVGSVDINTVDDCLDVLEVAFRSDLWKNLPNEDRLRMGGRLKRILLIAHSNSIPEEE